MSESILSFTMRKLTEELWP